MNFTGNPLSIQLYTLREEAKTDFPGVLKKVAELGIGAVEFAGLNNHKAEDIKKVMNEAGLKATGCHVGLPDLQSKFDEMKRDYVDVLGCEYITVPSGPRKFDDGGTSWKNFCREMREMKKKCDGAGIKLAYHNHAFEFENTIDGRTPFEWMFYDAPEDSPLCELDICWVAAGKHDPVNELTKMKGRVKMVHVKDMDPGMPPKDADVGSGILQWPSIFKAAEAAGVKWLILERDHPSTPAWSSVEKSLEHLKSEGLI